MENFILIGLLFMAGMGLRRLPAFPDNSAMSFNMYVIYIALPAMVLLHVPKLPLSTNLLTPMITPWIVLPVSAIVVVFLSRWLGWSRDVVGALLLLTTMGNTSFLGVPMVQAFFPSEAVAYALLYDQLGTFLIVATYGSVVVTLYGHDGNRPTGTAILKKVLQFPPFIAMVLAFSLRGVVLPEWGISILQRLADTLVPVVIFAVGFQFRFQVDAHHRTALAAGLLIKMVAAPLAVLAVTRMLGLSGLAVDVTIFESGMPAMITAGAMAMAAGLAPELAASLVGMGIPLSFLTLWLLHGWIG
ncbi:MAG: AEC family transporter [Magnetococcales bacterium]|nr:AEC family transporter [Magnetococcales bacterium]NGZ27746.1 AEC family transporter [Magnetococcales bacterium]